MFHFELQSQLLFHIFYNICVYIYIYIYIYNNGIAPTYLIFSLVELYVMDIELSNIIFIIYVYLCTTTHYS